jgi:hypothetical protein
MECQFSIHFNTLVLETRLQMLLREVQYAFGVDLEGHSLPQIHHYFHGMPYRLCVTPKIFPHLVIFLQELPLRAHLAV